MPITEETESTITRFMGAFDKTKLIHTIRGYLRSEGYRISEPTLKHKVGGSGANILITMKADKKRTHYVRFNITVGLMIMDMKDVEIIQEGNKTKMQYGKVEFRVGGDMELDYKRRFEQNKFMEGLRKFYHDFIIKSDIEEDWQDELDETIDGLQETVREFLKVEAQ